MLPSPSIELHEHLAGIARKSQWLMQAMRAVRDLGLASWCIGAGAVPQVGSAVQRLSWATDQ